jgi:alanyl-tRNA synthetase
VSKVVSCSPCQIERLVQGKKEKVPAFEVLLEDTVFFPEGGGQVIFMVNISILKFLISKFQILFSPMIEDS